MSDFTAALRRHRYIGLDTSIFVYYIERSLRFDTLATVALEMMRDGDYLGQTSMLTLMELAVAPLQAGRPELADEYEFLLRRIPHLTIVGLTDSTMRRAAELRARHGLKSLDALHIAACREHGATAFLTNDKRLRHVSNVEVLVLEDYLDD